VFEYDSLTSEDRWNEYFDVALANPPFMSPKGGIRPHKRFGIESNRAEVLFVDYIMEHLTPKGRAGIVVPEGIIFQSGTAYKSLRRTMVDKYLVGVVSLPSGVFNPYSGVKTSILVLDRELSQKTDKIFFAKVENDGFDLGAQRREIDKTDLPVFIEEITSYLNGLRNGKEVGCKKLNFVTKEKILESNDVGLSYDRYSTGNRLITEFEKIHLGNKEYFEIVSGGTPNTEIDEYWNGTIPWISLVDLPQEDMISIIQTTKRTITEIGLKNSSTKIASLLEKDFANLKKDLIEESVVREVILTNNFALMSFEKISDEQIQL
jgi:type I restriction enzyme M protein